MAVLQGVTELFPISSLGHAVILPRLLNWGARPQAPTGSPIFRSCTWGRRSRSSFSSGATGSISGLSLAGLSGERSRSADRRVFWLVVLATIPAVLVGSLFRKPLGDAFATPAIASRSADRQWCPALFRATGSAGRGVGGLDQLNWKGALAIGVAQCFALIPGISRSGATIAAGVVAGLRHSEAARFSFLMATPIILAANVYEAPKLLKEGATFGPMSVLSGVVAGVVAYASLVLLMRWFHKHDFEALSPFAYYCWAAGAIFLAIITLA